MLADPLIWPAVAGILAVALAAMAFALVRLRRTARPQPLPALWAVSPRPVFSTDERRIFRLLREALPQHTVLAKLPLVRFCQPSEPDEVRYWYDLLGSINVTFAICSANGRVLAAIDLERTGSRRTLQIKQSVLGACRVRYLRVPVDNLPTPLELQSLVPQSGVPTRFADSLPRPLSVASESLSHKLASRRAERGALWQDSRSFGDSFFAPDSRFDGYSVSETAEADLAPAELAALAASRDRAIAAVVVDAPDPPEAAPRVAGERAASTGPPDGGDDADLRADREAAGRPEAPYAGLSPGIVLDALDAVGLRGDGRLLQLNSYENRVFQVFLEDGATVVAKFYRPGRWSDAQILEEHAFARELAAAEIPVAAPLALPRDADSPHAGAVVSLGETLAELQLPDGGTHRYGVTPRLGGRGPELDDPAVRQRIGHFIGRLHAESRRGAFATRDRMDVATFGRANRDWLIERRVLPPDAEARWRASADRALDACDRAFAAAGAAAIRLHGDCHLGNILWSGDGETGGPAFVDFDDCTSGPAVQDLWMLLDGDRATMQRQLGDVLDGYEAFVELDRRELALVEPLRTLRMLHHSAWIARRWHDPAFPIAFPWFESPAYWQEQCTRLEEQLEAMAEPPLVA